MLAIRQFEAERKEWEDERDNLNLTIKDVNEKKQEVEQKLESLAGEVERLRSAESARPQQQGPVLPTEQVRSRHEQQLALMATIDSLRNELNEEQTKSRTMEKRASQVELTNQRLIVELDRCRGAAAHARQAQEPAHPVLPIHPVHSRSPYKYAGDTLSQGGTSEGSLHDELLETKSSLDRKSGEIYSLENETLRLREELNHEKQKVIDLKQASHKRSAVWKEELAKLSEELEMKQRLEEIVVQFRQKNDELTKHLVAMTDREEIARINTERLQRELEEARAARRGAHDIVVEKDAELEVVSKTFGCQLIAMEKELTQQVQKTSQCLELFLHHAYEPLASIRHSCRQIALSGDAGNEMWVEQVPALYEANLHDLKTNLVIIVDLLRFAAKILEAREQQQPRQKEQGNGTWRSISGAHPAGWLKSAFA